MRPAAWDSCPDCQKPQSCCSVSRTLGSGARSGSVSTTTAPGRRAAVRWLVFTNSSTSESLGATRNSVVLSAIFQASGKRVVLHHLKIALDGFKLSRLRADHLPARNQLTADVGGSIRRVPVDKDAMVENVPVVPQPPRQQIGFVEKMRYDDAHGVRSPWDSGGPARALSKANAAGHAIEKAPPQPRGGFLAAPHVARPRRCVWTYSRSSSCAEKKRSDHSRMNVTSRVTRYSVILPFSTLPFIEMISNPVMPRSVLAARFMPSSTASWKPFDDAAVILLTRATAMIVLPW